MLFPNAEDVGDTATRPFTYVDEIEHLNKCAVTRVGNAATLRRLHVDTKAAGFVTELFCLARERGIHTCLDTSGITYREEEALAAKKHILEGIILAREAR